MWLFKTLGFGSSSFAAWICLELCSGSYIIKQERNLLCWIKLIKLSSSGSIEWHLPLLSQPKFYCCANFFHGDVALNENKVEVNRTTVAFVELLPLLPSKPDQVLSLPVDRWPTTANHSDESFCFGLDSINCFVETLLREIWPLAKTCFETRTTAFGQNQIPLHVELKMFYQVALGTKKYW